MEIPGLRGLKPARVAKQTFDEFLRDDLLTYAAALAYHLLFALFPFLAFLIALLSFLDIPGLFERILMEAQRALPQQSFAEVRRVISEVQAHSTGGLLSFGILTTIWVASIGMRSAMNALNQVYDVREGRARWKRYSLSIVYTIGFALLVVVATALMVAGPQLTAALAERVGLGGAFLTAWAWLRVPAALLLAMLAVSLVYYFAPHVEQRFRLVTPGSVLAVLLWAAVSAAFQYYVANFGRYDVVYGSIGAVVVLLLYFFLSSTMLLLGGELNAVIYAEAPRPDDPRDAPPEPGRGPTPRHHRAPDE